MGRKKGIGLGRCKPGLEAKVHPTIQDICWAAGLYEGEGSCVFNKRSEQVQIAQKGKEISLRLKRLFGGSVVKNKCWKSSGYMYNWVSYGARARGFVMTIYKFMTIRRKKQISKMLYGNQT